MSFRIRCCVPGCENKKTLRAYLNYASFHNFPSNIEMRQKWLKAIFTATGVTTFSIKENYYVCSEHFTETCFRNDTRYRRLLRRDAVPTIFRGLTDEEKQNYEQMREKISRIGAWSDVVSAGEDV